LQGGVAHFTFAIDGTELVSWSADAKLPSRRPNGDNSTRYTVRGPGGRGVELKTGDVLRVEGAPDAGDPAALDYIEVDPVQ
jgi:alpha-glucuronidase